MENRIEKTKNRNCIILNGQKVELTKKQVAQMCAALGLDTARNSTLSTVAVGKACHIGKFEFVVLEHFEDGTTAVVLKNCYGDPTPFGINNNYYNGSRARDYCLAFQAELESLVGANNLVKHTLDLTALNGQRDYAAIQTFVSPLTIDDYRRYSNPLSKHKLDQAWWLATPQATAASGNSNRVLYVNTDGTETYRGVEIYPGVCNTERLGIRPRCILKSSAA